MALSVMRAVAMAAAVFGTAATASTWAQFCDDNACSVNCGEAVGRQSLGYYTSPKHRLTIRNYLRDLQPWLPERSRQELYPLPR